MSSVPGTWQQAVAWLENQSKHPDKNYKDLCSHLASRAFGFDGAGADASPWGRSIPERYRVYGSNPPKGALVFWVTNGWGHVAVSYGKGRVICNNAVGGVSVQNISYYAGLGQPFWVRRPNLKRGIAFKLAWGRNPGKWPYVAPKPAPKADINPVVARPGQRSSAVPALRKALGGKSSSTHYGMVLKRRVVKYKRKHGVTPANGIVRRYLFGKITKGK